MLIVANVAAYSMPWHVLISRQLWLARARASLDWLTVNWKIDE